MRADKQTAVEWLSEQLSYSTTHGEIISYHKIITNLIERAKEMEREALIEFYEDGLYAANYPHSLTGEAYFQKEYGNKD
jgi:hypothetical protein